VYFSENALKPTQWSTPFTREGSQVQSLSRPPLKANVSAAFLDPSFVLFGTKQRTKADFGIRIRGEPVDFVPFSFMRNWQLG